MKPPRAVAIEQLNAYNRCDLDAFFALFAENAVLIDLPSGQVVVEGMAQIRAMYRERFANPELLCRVHATNVIGDFAIDRETVYGLPDGPVDMVWWQCIKLKTTLIQRVLLIRA